ncbi:hypothetical protein Sgou_00970 [Streptomyces gougerotii]|uniref:AMP-dependent synthetase/ligase domain-containing protein n=1 Tax=Streptomyces gougerotii TaxID=53448 RepID=A0ABQ1CYQ0_9ACTN|nr:hypothetical protein Sgou_00970 [Streptomyces gougerotii]
MREFSLPALYEVPADGNLTDIVRRNAERHPDVAVIARKVDGAWEDLTATAFLAEVRAAAKGLMASGVQPGDRVGLLSRTRYEWTLMDFAIWSAGAVTVPVYETSSPEQIEWILGDSGAVACVVETPGHAASVESVRGGLPALKHVWQLDAGGVAELERAGAGLSDEAVDERSALAGADDPATIVYTSGTTGRPKGCVLTHRSFFAECGNVVARLKPLFRTGECSVLLFLPVAHVFGRLVEVAALMAPIRLGLVPDIKHLTDELASFRPTMVLGVPRVFEKVYNSARAKAQADGKGKIFDKAAETAIAYSRALDTPAGSLPRPEAEAQGLRQAGLQQAPHGPRRPRRVRDLRRRPARRAARPLLPRHRLHGAGGVRPDRVLRGHRLQPVGPPEDRHGRSAAARFGGPHRRRRRGPAPRRAPLRPVLEQRGGDP